MSITDIQIKKILSMLDSNQSISLIIEWIDSQENAQDIFNWFNKFMQGYAVKKA